MHAIDVQGFFMNHVHAHFVCYTYIYFFNSSLNRKIKIALKILPRPT